MHRETQNTSTVATGTNAVLDAGAAAANVGQNAIRPTQGPDPFEFRPVGGLHNTAIPNDWAAPNHIVGPFSRPHTRGVLTEPSGTGTGTLTDTTAAATGTGTIETTIGTDTHTTETKAKDKAKDKDKPKAEHTEADIKKESVSKDGNTTVRVYKDGTKEKIIKDGDKVTTISYNANGVRTNKTIKAGKGDDVTETVVNYNKKGKPKNKTITDGDKTTVVNYNKDGQKINKTVTQGEGDNKVVSTAQYDPKTGNVTARTKEGIIEGNNVSISKEYDPKTGKLTSKNTVTTAPDGTTTKEQVAYEYDKDGNMTKRAATDDNGHITTSVYSDYVKGKDGTMTRNVAITITTATGNQIGDVVYKEQTMNEAGKITSSNWFSDPEHKNQTKDVKYTYDENNVKQSATVLNFDKDGNKIKETTQNNFQKTANGTTYDSTTKTYEQAADGSIKEVIVTRPKIKYFNGATYFLNTEFDKTEYKIGARRTEAEEETGEARENDDTEDTGKAAAPATPAAATDTPAATGTPAAPTGTPAAADAAAATGTPTGTDTPAATGPKEQVCTVTFNGAPLQTCAADEVIIATLGTDGKVETTVVASNSKEAEAARKNNSQFVINPSTYTNAVLVMREDGSGLAVSSSSVKK